MKEYGYSWHLMWDINNQSWYARQSAFYIKEDGSYSSKQILLHRWLVNAQDGYHVDHINHDTLDNRKDNLRVTISGNNSANRKGANSNNNTGVRNVSWLESHNEYWVQIMRKGIRYKRAFPADQFEEACKFAEQKRIEIFGEFAGDS